MQSNRFKWFAILLALTWAFPAQAGVIIHASGQGYALLIGISQYEDQTLSSVKYADRDVQETAKTLVHGGYSPENAVVRDDRVWPAIRPRAVRSRIIVLRSGGWTGHILGRSAKRRQIELVA